MGRPAAAAPPPPLPALLLLLLLLLRAGRPRGAELTVRLPGGARQCFHQDVGRGARLSLDYQVIGGGGGGGGGGHVAVDCSVEDTRGRTVYRGAGKQSDSFAHRAGHADAYRLCIGSELPAFSPKTVYFDVRVGDRPPGSPGALTQMKAACVRIHEALRTVAEAQTLSRRRGPQAWARAEELLRRVSLWALGQALALGAVGAGQVLLLRGLFARPLLTSTCSYPPDRPLLAS